MILAVASESSTSASLQPAGASAASSIDIPIFGGRALNSARLASSVRDIPRAAAAPATIWLMARTFAVWISSSISARSQPIAPRVAPSDRRQQIIAYRAIILAATMAVVKQTTARPVAIASAVRSSRALREGCRIRPNPLKLQAQVGNAVFCSRPELGLMGGPLKWYDANATDNPPWIKALAEVRLWRCSAKGKRGPEAPRVVLML
jgi:hypothetical protein